MTANQFDQEGRTLEDSVTNGIRAALGVSGLVSLIVGIVILVWPGKTAVVVAGIVAAYALIAGIVNIAIGIFSRKLGGWARVGYLVLGAVFLISSILAFANLGATAAGLGILLGVVIGISWIMEGVAGLTMLGGAASRVWAILYAIISIVAGIMLLTSPLWGVAVLALLLGFSLVILGVVQIVRALRFSAS